MLRNPFNRENRPLRRLMAELAYHDIEVALAANFHIVEDGKLYRSSQPDRQQFIEMEKKYGCRSILNLRCKHSDLPVISGLQLREFRLKTHRMTEADIKTALEIIRDAPMPMLVHCCRGTDRTGLVIAAYRIVFEDWLPSDALAEFRDSANGRHRYIYRRFPRLIRKIDWKALKNEILAGRPAETPAGTVPETETPVGK